MAYQGINTGTTPNDGTGDTMLDGAVKINSNFGEIYNLIGNGSSLVSGVVTTITAGTNVNVSASTGSVEISAPTPVSIATTDVDVSRNLRVAGVSTLSVLITSGITTLASQGGVTTTGGDFYVGGDLYVNDDIVYDEVNGRNINISGVGSFGSIFIGAGHSAGSIDVAGVSTLSGNVSLGGSISLLDDKKILLGDNDEFEIFHDNVSGNVIKSAASPLEVEADFLNIKSGAGSTIVGEVNTDGNYNVSLYHNDFKRFETTSPGILVTGICSATSFLGDGSSLTGVVTTLSGADGSGLTGVVTTLTGADGSGLTGVVTTLTGADGSGLTGVVTTLTGADGSGLTGITTLISAGSNITVTTNAGITTISSTGGGVGVGTTTVSTDSLVVSGVSTLGVVTGATYYGDASYITHSKWDLNADGTSHYLFTGPAGLSSASDPVLYLARGQNYEFVNTMGAHPFEIRESNGGSAFSTGITNNAVSNGTLRFEVPFSAPNSLYYQCTSHAGMGGTIVVYPNLHTV